MAETTPESVPRAENRAVQIEFDISEEHLAALHDEVAAGNALNISEALRAMIADGRRWREPLEGLAELTQGNQD